jgi:hypothetical protein
MSSFRACLLSFTLLHHLIQIIDVPSPNTNNRQGGAPKLTTAVLPYPRPSRRVSPTLVISSHLVIIADPPTPSPPYSHQRQPLICMPSRLLAKSALVISSEESPAQPCSSQFLIVKAAMNRMILCRNYTTPLPVAQARLHRLFSLKVSWSSGMCSFWSATLLWRNVAVVDVQLHAPCTYSCLSDTFAYIVVRTHEHK